MERSRAPEPARGGGARPAGDAVRDEGGRDNGRGDHDLAATDRERPPARREGNNGAAIAALVVGILAILVLVLSLGTLFIVALPLGIAAIVLGVVGKRKADGRGRDGHAGAKHRGKARAGFWLGLITTILSILLLIGAVTILTDQGFQQQIRDLIDQGRQQVPG